MSNEITNYNLNILLSMILSHFITDFVLQSDKMVMEKNSKSWKSAYLLLHILITFLTALFSFNKVLADAKANHQSLVEKNGYYARMLELQSGF